MRIAFGLPNATRDVGSGRLFVDLARRAEELGFASVATIGRVAYPNYEELVVLAAAAAVTSRIGLFTNVLLGPAREPVLLAKQAASLDQISGGRFVLGVGVGARPDDFDVVGADFHTRGRRWDQALELMHRAWAGEIVPGSPVPVTPSPVNGQSVPMLFGGRSEAMVRRVVRWGAGHTQTAGLDPEHLRQARELIEPAWKQAGRDGSPEFRALTYFSLDPALQARGEHNIRQYYGAIGERTWSRTLKSVEQLREVAHAYEEAGCDELVIGAAVPEVRELELLAEAVL